MSNPGSPHTSSTRRRLLTGLGVATSGVVAGCATTSDTPTPRGVEATITIRLRNRDSSPRSYEVTVQQGGTLRNGFSGTLPAEQSERAELIATVRVTDTQYTFQIATDGGQSGRTWEPSECGAFLVDAVIEDGQPGFETSCRETPTEGW